MFQQQQSPQLANFGTTVTVKVTTSSTLVSFERLLLEEQDKSSDIEHQPPFGDRKISNIQPQNRGGVQNQQRSVLAKYEESAVENAIPQNTHKMLLSRCIWKRK